MPLERGQVLLSLRGRDKGYLLALVGTDGDYLLVCDGKERPLERPKKKSPKHLKVLPYVLSEEQLKANGRIKRALRSVDFSQEGVEQYV